MSDKIRALREGKRFVYIHNDLSTAAWYFKERFEEKLKKGERDGIAFDIMACLVMLAFTFEAKLNFLGDRLIEDWNERMAFDKKVSTVFDHLKIARDEKQRPYSSMELLKQFRDTLAHGKPIKEEFSEIVEGKPEELDRRIDLSGAWEKDCNEDVARAASEDLDIIWKDLIKAAGLNIYDTMHQGEGGLTFIERLVDG